MPGEQARKWISPNGKRVYMVRQILNDTLSYRIVSVPLAKASEYYAKEYANMTRFMDFDNYIQAQTTLDEYADREGLLAYKG